MNKIIQIIQEELEKFDYNRNKVAGKEVRPNRIVFHVSESKNRGSIESEGLIPNVGQSYSSWIGTENAIPAIFATNTTIKEVTGGVDINKFNADIWAIDTSKINNKWYVDNHFSAFEKMGINNPHIVTFERIPREALYLYNHYE